MQIDHPKGVKQERRELVLRSIVIWQGTLKQKGVKYTCVKQGLWVTEVTGVRYLLTAAVYPMNEHIITYLAWSKKKWVLHILYLDSEWAQVNYKRIKYHPYHWQNLETDSSNVRGLSAFLSYGATAQIGPRPPPFGGF
jgi:hypothetical protein